MDKGVMMTTLSSPAEAAVTVVIPCFRNRPTIARAITSVAKQTVRPVEVVVVDDASLDGTAEYVAEVAKDYQPGWIRMIRLDENRGVATARNAGWDAATQPFVAFLDADDTWHPKKIELQYGFMVKTPEVVLCGHRHKQLRAKGEYERNHADVFAEGRVTVKKWQMLVSNRFITPSVMLRREVPYRFREGKRYMEDHLLWLQLVCDGAHVVRLDAKLAFIHKAPFGESGLSARLWSMEKGDLENYWCLAKEKRLSGIAAFLLSFYSLLKFGRRLVLHGIAVVLLNGVPSPARY